MVQNSGDRLRITANRWAGRVECVGRGYVVAIADGFEPNDLLAGYRVFSTNNIVTLGDEFFVTEPRRLATPCRRQQVRVNVFRNWVFGIGTRSPSISVYSLAVW